MSPEEIRARRRALGWSQAQLAAAAGTNQQNIDRIERGVVSHARALPAIEQALRRAAGAAGAVSSYDTDPSDRVGARPSGVAWSMADPSPAASSSAPSAAVSSATPPSAAGHQQTELWAPPVQERGPGAMGLWRDLRPVHPLLTDGGLRVVSTPCDLVAPPPFLLPVGDAFGLLLEGAVEGFDVGDLLWVSPSLPARPGGPGIWLSGPLESAPAARLFARPALDSPASTDCARIVAVYFRR
jgi:transcriptional regulator with XRE-family HTH domain